MIPLRAILFDLDGTLIDSKKDIAESVRFIQAQFGCAQSSEETIAGFIGDGVRKLIERALLNASPELIDQAVEAFKDRYRLHCLEHTCVYPGTHELLDYFSGKPMAIVTNKPWRITNRILVGLKLDHHFGAVLGGDSLPRKKPDPAPVLEALKQLKIPETEGVLIVGDTSNDVLAGRAAGIMTCGIFSNIGNHEFLNASKPDYLVKTLLELTRLFS